MLTSIVVALMVILITAFWVYQGFFRSALMLLETIVAFMLAFGFYEALNGLWTDKIGDGLGLPIALMLIFLGILLGLRVLTDKMISGDVKLQVVIDRAGAGLCGFFTGMILVGTALLSIQMLPIGSSVFGFERITPNSEGRPEENNFMFSPDRFAASMAGMLSSGRFGGSNPLSRSNPDRILALYSGRATPQPEARIFLPANALQVKAYWQTREIDHVTHTIENSSEGAVLAREFETQEPLDAGNKFIVCYVNLQASAAPKGSKEIRFRPLQFRLTGPPPGSDDQFAKPPQVYLACGMSDIYTHRNYNLKSIGARQAKRLVRFGPATDLILGPKQTKPVAKMTVSAGQERCSLWRFDVAFEVPEDFEPWYVEFKRGAIAEIKPDLKKEEIPKWGSKAYGSSALDARPAQPQAPKVGQAPGGATHVANAIDERTDASNLLPIPLDRSEAVVARHARGNRLRGGDNCHFWVPVPAKEIAAGNHVSEFQVPGDKRMIQVGAHSLESESVLGGALNFAARVVAQIKVGTDDGREYFAIGQYAAAQVGGQQVFEIQYYPDAGLPERCLKKPKKIKRRDLTRAGPDSYKFGYLFLVDPGAKIVSFHAGQTTQALNIQAPS